MYFPKYWSKGSDKGTTCWGWSDHSTDEAKQRATEAARKLSTRLAQNKSTTVRAHSYDYADRPLKEPVLEELSDLNGKGAALISRNSEGCFVLNTAQIMFLDIDSNPSVGKGIASFFTKVFGGKVKEPHQEALEKIHAWSSKNPRWGLRIYGTAGGLRILVTHDFFDPAQVGSMKVFDELEVDPLYRKLCITQKSFRARLSPKPYRCSYYRCPVRWPWSSPEEQQEFKSWEIEYAESCESVATCMFLSKLGSQQIPPEIERIIQVHDQKTKAMTKQPLA